jgi:16S rRNA C1402 N4-methylase RsmH
VVKLIFRENSHKGLIKIKTRKPLKATFKEISSNPRARAAKLRIAQKL